MNYGTQTALKYRTPYTKYKPFVNPGNLSAKAQMRLKWMDYIYAGNKIPQCARHFDHPYRTVKYWYDRFDPNDLTSLEDKSKRPKKVRKPETTREQEALIYDARVYELPGAGKVTLQRYILNEEGIHIGQQAIQRVINTRGLKRVKKDKRKVKYRKNRKHMYSVPEKAKKVPGGLVYLDVKHLKIAKQKWYQFTALDHATRMLRTKLYRRITAESTKEFFAYLDETYPFDGMQYIGTDNGSEFLGVFDQNLEERGIEHVFSSPSSPKQNPYVERVIRSIIDQQYRYYGLEETPELQQEALDMYCYKYNYKRPHHGINLLTPIQMFAKLTTNNSL